MILETERLYIRPLAETDWQEMKGIFSDFANSVYADFDTPLPTGDNEVQKTVKRFAESGLCYAVFLKKSNDMIGYVCFQKYGNKYDIGYCFHSSCHSNGYAYESADALIEYLVDEYGATVFSAGTALDNIPSCRLLKKLGFVCVSTETVSFDKVFSFRGGRFERTVQIATRRA